MGSSQPDCLSVSFGYATDQFVHGVLLGHRKPYFVPTGSHVARVRGRASSWGQRLAYDVSLCFVLFYFTSMAMRSFVTRQEKMPPRRGAHRGGGRGGRGAGHTQSDEQPVV
ncbi:hypothetical protein E5676_scaffold749G00500 [Cucumis melo var. makuwa]|uniref:Uncharacterized protein n=1 Tax=Cucumis melo var. makuwa TaxID=1194695 RepID=A0A5D3DWJ1_CUCMM|nr:hypothetical protein E5676_scaffold749G00500 [Cucumis melo var. makuwa]